MRYVSPALFSEMLPISQRTFLRDVRSAVPGLAWYMIRDNQVPQAVYLVLGSKNRQVRRGHNRQEDEWIAARPGGAEEAPAATALLATRRSSFPHSGLSAFFLLGIPDRSIPPIVLARIPCLSLRNGEKGR